MVELLTLLVIATVGQYEPPPAYYNSATGTGVTLESQLHDIIDNHVVRSYDDARFALALLDQDPNNPDNIILIYDQLSVDGTWDGGVTFTREHVWPRSRQVIGAGANDTGPDNSDLHILRPCTSSVNGARGAKNFGGIGVTYGPSGVYWFPGLVDTGDVARALFYMQVRYDGSDVATTDLELTNGDPAIQQGLHGDLSRLLQWHFSDPVSVFERRRNHLIYSSADNPSYFQANRNPFIDRPEFVWAIWGTSPNDSTIYLGDTAPGDGASSLELDLRVITGAGDPSQIVTLNKAGTTPTTFTIADSGDAASIPTGPRQAFFFNPDATDITVSVATNDLVGQYTGTITIDNTDLTSAAAGQGSADGNDTINVTANVLDHAEASFDDDTDLDTRVIEFASIAVGNGLQTLTFAIHNLEATPGLTADLSLDGLSGTGHTAVLYTDLAPPDTVPAGQGLTFTAYLDSENPVGTYEAVYELDVSDEPIPGAQPGQTLTLTLRATLNPRPIPTASDWSVLVAAMLVLTTATLILGRRPTSPVPAKK